MALFRYLPQKKSDLMLRR